MQYCGQRVQLSSRTARRPIRDPSITTRDLTRELWDIGSRLSPAWAGSAGTTSVRMLDVLNLALPFFGLIFLGLLCGKLKQIPETGLAWMNFFLIYVSLPCLFYRVLAQTPLEQLNNPRFIVGTMLATATVFALSFAIGWLFRRHMAEATIAGLSGAYGNIGYMGPGLALATLGRRRERAGRADLLFRHAAAVRARAVPDDARRSAP